MTGSVPTPYSEEPLAVIEEEARAMAACFGVVAADEAAASLVDRVRKRLGGTHIYIPQRTARERAKLHQEIVSKFNGRNLRELAREHELTPRHVRRILLEGRSSIASEG